MQKITSGCTRVNNIDICIYYENCNKNKYNNKKGFTAGVQHYYYTTLCTKKTSDTADICQKSKHTPLRYCCSGRPRPASVSPVYVRIAGCINRSRNQHCWPPRQLAHWLPPDNDIYIHTAAAFLWGDENVGGWLLHPNNMKNACFLSETKQWDGFSLLVV